MFYYIYMCVCVYVYNIEKCSFIFSLSMYILSTIILYIRHTYVNNKLCGFHHPVELLKKLTTATICCRV
jgi:hypothetical protein